MAASKTGERPTLRAPSARLSVRELHSPDREVHQVHINTGTQISGKGSGHLRFSSILICFDNKCFDFQPMLYILIFMILYNPVTSEGKPEKSIKTVTGINFTV